MKLGIAIEESWAFFHEVHAELSAHHQTSLFEPRRSRAPIFRQRLERAVWRRDLRAFLDRSQVVFFEWASRLLAEASRMPKSAALVTRLHRYEMYQWVGQIDWDAVDRVVLVSEAKRREFLARFPRLVDRTAVIPEAISLDRFPFRPKDYQGRLGTLCHLSPRKRVYELILAFSELSRRAPGTSLHIGGGPHPKFPDYQSSLHSLVRRLGLEDKVTFYGPIDDPAGWYGGIDVFVSNSYSEGLQVSPMEAMAAGCDCLSHWWDGADELLPADHLFHTESQLIDRVLHLTGMDEAERQGRRERLRARVADRFDVAQTAVRLRRLLEDVGAARASWN